MRGAERALVNLANGLDKTRYQVTVQTLMDVGELRCSLSTEVTYLPGLPWLIRGNVHLFKLLSPQQAYRCIIKKKYDVVIAYLEGTVTRIVSGCPYPDTKLITWVHGQQISRKNILYCYRNDSEMVKCIKRFVKVVCVAKTLKNELLHLIPELDESSICVLQNVIDTEKIMQMSSIFMATNRMQEEGLKVITIGSLVKVKGYDRLIKAHKQLLNYGLYHNIYIIGDGEERSTLQKISSNLGVKSTVHFLGKIDNPYPYLKFSDIYVCSSYQEGLNTAVIEALVLGIPIISTECSGAKELLGHNNEYGFVTENNNESLCKGLSLFLSNSEMRNYYRKRSMERGAYFDKQKAVDAVEQMIDNLK